MAQYMAHPSRMAPALWALACAAFLAGCESRPITANAPPPSLQEQALATPSAAPVADTAPTPAGWSGSYQSIMPCSNCNGIAMSVQLREDMTVMVRTRYLHADGTPAKVHSQSWPFRFDPPGSNMITVGTPDTHMPAAYRFLLGEGWIELRHHQTGAAGFPRSQYRLRKTSEAP